MTIEFVPAPREVIIGLERVDYAVVCQDCSSADLSTQRALKPPKLLDRVLLKGEAQKIADTHERVFGTDHRIRILEQNIDLLWDELGGQKPKT